MGAEAKLAAGPQPDVRAALQERPRPVNTPPGLSAGAQVAGRGGDGAALGRAWSRRPLPRAVAVAVVCVLVPVAAAAGLVVAVAERARVVAQAEGLVQVARKRIAAGEAGLGRRLDVYVDGQTGAPPRAVGAAQVTPLAPPSCSVASQRPVAGPGRVRRAKAEPRDPQPGLRRLEDPTPPSTLPGARDQVGGVPLAGPAEAAHPRRVRTAAAHRALPATVVGPGPLTAAQVPVGAATVPQVAGQEAAARRLAPVASPGAPLGPIRTPASAAVPAWPPGLARTLTPSARAEQAHGSAAVARPVGVAVRAPSLLMA